MTVVMSLTYVELSDAGSTCNGSDFHSCDQRVEGIHKKYDHIFVFNVFRCGWLMANVVNCVSWSNIHCVSHRNMIHVKSGESSPVISSQ